VTTEQFLSCFDRTRFVFPVLTYFFSPSFRYTASEVLLRKSARGVQTKRKRNTNHYVT